MQRAWSLKIVRFASVGVVNTGLDFLMLNIFVAVFGLPVLLANIVSVSIGVTISYFLNHHVVFRHNHQITWQMYLRFFVITGISIVCIQTTVIYLVSPLVSHTLSTLAAHMAPHGQFIATHNEQLTLNISKALAIPVGLLWNYTLYSKIVFSTPNKKDDAKD